LIRDSVCDVCRAKDSLLKESFSPQTRTDWMPDQVRDDGEFVVPVIDGRTRRIT
jgi:hypothetical protein